MQSSVDELIGSNTTFWEVERQYGLRRSAADDTCALLSSYEVS